MRIAPFWNASRSIGIAVGLGLGCACAAVPAQSLNTAELYARLQASVWVVRTFDKDDLPLSQGSAVVIGAQTLVTNCHVLRKAKRVEVTHDKAAWPASLELWDTARDLCQLKANGVKAPPVPLAEDGAVVVGQPVVALGTPAGLELTLSTGIVSGLRHDDGRRLVAIQTSAAISHGSSGGGLFDDQGRLIGVTTAFIGGNAQNLNLAVPVGMVRELPDRHAAAQAAKGTPAKVADSAAQAGSTAPRASVARADGEMTAALLSSGATLAGQWSGEYRCGAFMGSGQAANPSGWKVPATMTVGSDGSVAMVRGDASYSETITGNLQPDLSTTLKGRGAYKGNQTGTWNAELSGRFVDTGNDVRFDGDGTIASLSGEVSRRCSVRLTKRTSGPSTRPG